MAYVDWMIKGPKIASCSCAYGCPCEFNAPPTSRPCEGLEAQRIDEGYFGDLRLDGLIIGARYRWPGPVHEGGAVVQGLIDARASEAQVEALFKILGGEEQEPHRRRAVRPVERDPGRRRSLPPGPAGLLRGP